MLESGAEVLSSSIIACMKRRRTRRAELKKKRYAHKDEVINPEGKRPLGSPRA
jgi:hypothetical protein